MTQKDRLLQHLRIGNTLTSLQAWDRLGIARLASRVYDLKRDGIEVIKESITVSNRWGEECNVTRYSLPTVGQMEML